MPIVKFTYQTMPESGEQLQAILKESLENAAPLEDFIHVIRELTRYEMDYNMNSQTFYERFERGEMGDSIEFMRWANKYEIYQEMRADMQTLLDLVSKYALPVSP
ncbi:MAG: hypothetical protein ACLFTI_08105 [Anaerolineales bacterium]